MDLTQIRYFIALARLLNFTRAAEACNVSQPALTKSIQRLEDELGGPLLLRERALTQLTPLGQQMLPLLQHVDAASRRAKEHAAGLLRSEVSPLRLGVSPDVPLALFAPLMAEVSRRFARAELRLTEACDGALVDALLKGDLDLCLMFGAAPLPDRMNRWPLFADAVVLLAPVDAEDMLLDDVRSGAVDWIRTQDMTAAVEAAVRAMPRPRHEAANRSQAAVLSRAGFGAIFSTLRAPPEPGLTRRSLEWQEEHDVLLVSVAGRPLSPAVDAFIKLARARAWQPL